MIKEKPKGWAECKLEDCSIILDNLRQPVSASERAKREGNIPYYGATGQAGWIDDYLFDEELILVGEDGAPFFDKFKNVAYKIKGKSWVNNHAHVLKALDNVTLNAYLLHYLNYFDYTGFVGGSTRLKLTQGKLRTIPILLAPLAEQERIVTKLDSAFTHLEKLKVKLNDIPEQLKKFRQSVFIQAVSGKLTEEWRKSNIKLNFEDIVSKTKKERRKKWEEAQLKLFSENGRKPEKNWRDKYREPELLKSLNGGNVNSWSYQRIDFWADVIDPNPSHRNPKYVLDGFIFLSTAQFAEPDGWNISGINRVSKETVVEQEARCQFQKGSIAFSRKGTIGKTRMLPTEFRFALLDSVCVINPIDSINPKFLHFAIQSEFVQEQIRSLTRGVALKQVSIGAVRSLVIPMRSREEQNEVVKRVDALLERIKCIEAKYCFLKERIDSLPQILLVKAFMGGLVPQDEKGEPATKLLEKIKALKEGKSRSEESLGSDKDYEVNEQISLAAEE